MADDPQISKFATVVSSPAEKKNYLARIVEAESMDIEALALVMYLIVIANFCLGLVFVNTLPVVKHKLPEQFVQGVFVVYFLLFYLLFLTFTIRYANRVRAQYKKNPVRFLVWSGLLGLAVLSIITYFTLGMAATLNWLVPTVATLIGAYVIHLISERKGK